MSSLVSAVESSRTSYVTATCEQDRIDDSGAFGVLLSGVLGGMDSNDEHTSYDSQGFSESSSRQALVARDESESCERSSLSTVTEDQASIMDRVVEDCAFSEWDEVAMARGNDRDGEGETTRIEQEGKEDLQADGQEDAKSASSVDDEQPSEDAAETANAKKTVAAEAGEKEGDEAVVDEESAEQSEAAMEAQAVSQDGATQDGATQAEGGQADEEGEAAVTSDDVDAVEDAEESEELLEEEEDADAEVADDKDASESLGQHREEFQGEQRLQADISGAETRTFSSELSNIEALANRSAEGVDVNQTVSREVIQQVSSGNEMITRAEHIQQLADRFDQHILSMIRSSSENMTITITPDNLGKLVVSCQEREDGVEVHVQAENASVCNLLQQQENGIRDVLVQNGFKLNEFDVSTGNGEHMEQRRGKQADERQDGEHEFGQSSASGQHAESVEEPNQQRVSKDGVWLVA